MLLLLTSALASMPDPALRVESRHLAVLGGWSVANLVGGGVGLALADTAAARSFHGTNLAWNTVNATIAGVGLLGVSKRRGKLYDTEALAARHRGLRTALAVNIGLDVGYVAAGAALWAVGGEDRGALGTLDRAGVGRALVLQGAFLLAFDVAFLTAHRRRGGQVVVGPTGISGRW